MMVTTVLLAAEVRGQEPPALDHEIKAAFVHNFAKFVTWPPATFTSPQQPLRLGIVGDDMLARTLGMLQGRITQGRKLDVVHLAPGDSIDTYQMVYVAASARHRTIEVLAQSRGRAVLTIGDSPSFCEQGGIINLAQDGDRLRIEICAQRASSCGLKISSKLLQVARILDCSPK